MSTPPDVPEIANTPSEQFLARLIAALIGRNGASEAVLSAKEVDRMREKRVAIVLDEGMVRLNVQDKPR